MDGLMQNHWNKTIIMINDRKPGVATTATEKRTSHRKRPSEQLQKVNFFIETRDRKEPPAPPGAPHCYNQPANIYYRYLPRNAPQGDLLG